jgi:nitric oxide reductase NorQ protein
MSTSTGSETDMDVSDEQLVSHYLYQRIRRNGGPIEYEDAIIGARDVTGLDASLIKKLIEEGQESGRYKTARGDSHQVLIARANPIGRQPSCITEEFGSRNTEIGEFGVLDGVSSEIEALLEAYYDSFEDLAEADPESVAASVNQGLDAVAESVDFDSVTRLTQSECAALEDNGITTKRELVQADPEALASIKGTTLTEAKVSRAQEKFEDDVDIFSVEDAEFVIQSARREIPVGGSLAAHAVANHNARKKSVGEAKARVRNIEETTGKVGEPLAVVRDTLSVGDDEANYVSDIGHNSSTPVNTGLPVLEDVGYEKVPNIASDPDAGHAALPVDEDGEVVPPTVPLERDLQMPLDELVAKKLARNVPVRLVGPRGSGKNYLMKYLAYKTNRGYRSLDVDKSTMPQDLFGPISPDKDGVLEPKNADVKQGLLNGDIIVINEFPVMSAGAAMSMHQLLNENKLVIKEHGQEIDPHPQARIVITMNPPTREYRDSEPMNSATRGRFRTFWQGYPDTIDGEVRALDQQINTGETVVQEGTLKKVVEFAHRTRKDEMNSWPTLSTRNLTIICEHIGDGATPGAAVKNVLRNVAEPNQHPEAAFEAIGDLF